MPARKKKPTVRLWRRLSVGLGLLVAAEIVFLGVTETPREVSEVALPLAKLPPLPRVSIEIGRDGVEMARVDYESLVRWCKVARLPQPPELGLVEPSVAETLLSAMQDAAQDSHAEDFARLGMIYEHLARHDIAKHYFERAAERDPADFRWPYYVACIEQAAGRNEQAIGGFAKVLNLNESYPMTHGRLGQLYLEMSRWEEAAERFRRYVELAPHDSLGYVGLGRVALAQRKYENALRFLGDGLQRGANDFQCHYNLARVYAALGRDALANKHFDICRVLPKGKWFKMRDPLEQALHAAAGSIESVAAEFDRLKQTRDWPRLAELAEQVLKRRPEDSGLIKNLALIYSRLGRTDDARRMIERGLALRADDPAMRLVQAQIALGAQDFDTVLQATAGLLARTPGDPQASHFRARAFVALGRLDDAKNVLRETVQANPEVIENILLLGRVLRDGGEWDESAKAFAAALHLQPQNPTAIAGLEEANRHRDDSSTENP